MAGNVHAFVIGVGHYDDPSIPAAAAAARSALAFADWIKTRHASPSGLQLGTVEVLACDSPNLLVDAANQKYDRPTLANVKQRLKAWINAVDKEPESLLVFYFCGHGIESGGLISLLLADADLSDQNDPFANAIAFDDFRRGMDCVGPRQQLYIVDACRELPLGVKKWSTDVPLGDEIQRFNAVKRAQLGDRTAPVLTATSSTQKAWGGASGAWFTDAMLTVLQGAAGDNRFSPKPDEYVVRTCDIPDAIQMLVKEGFIAPPAGPQEPRHGLGEGVIQFHRPNPPAVPVLITRAPPATNHGVKFSIKPEKGQKQEHTFPSDDPWLSTLEIGDYTFQADGAPLETAVVIPRKRVELP